MMSLSIKHLGTPVATDITMSAIVLVVYTGSCGMELQICFIVVFCLRLTVAQETNTTSTSDFSAADCISYIYVAWVFFIYAVGLGLESSQYPQIITYIYLYIPETCGGNYEGCVNTSIQPYIISY